MQSPQLKRRGGAESPQARYVLFHISTQCSQAGLLFRGSVCVCVCGGGGSPGIFSARKKSGRVAQKQTGWDNFNKLGTG